MKTLFLDTNVVMDFLTDRKPFSKEAATLLDLGRQRKISIYISAISFNNIYYVSKSALGHEKTIHFLKELQQWVQVIALTDEILQSALNKGFKDFEDAIQYCSANSIQSLDMLVTRNGRDFKKGNLIICTPKEALSLIGTSD